MLANRNTYLRRSRIVIPNSLQMLHNKLTPTNRLDQINFYSFRGSYETDFKFDDGPKILNVIVPAEK